jgi:NADH-quinone oxidoreductase subunit M
MGGVKLLSAILCTPLVGTLLVMYVEARFVRAVALGASLVALLLSLYLGAHFEPVAGIQWAEHHPWAPEIGMSYSLGVDGISLPMVLLTTLMSLAALLAATPPSQQASNGSATAAPKTVSQGQAGFYAWMLLLEFGLLGVFLATDWFLFYMFWELTLIPMFFLIGVWGGSQKHAASLTFFLYTLAGSIPMLMSLLAAHLATPEHSFSMADMARASSQWSPTFQVALMAGLLLGFAVKIPLVPLHGWLPLAHVEAPIPGSMMLSAVLLKMGAYGVMRAGLLVPQGVQSFADLFLLAGLFNILYGALLASRQSDLKSVVAWSSVSHMGFVLLGISAFNIEGYIGATMQMLTHGLISGLLFLCVGMLYQRTGKRDLAGLTGAASALPGGTAVVVLALLANLGAPGLAGFISELHALVGAVEAHGLVVLLASVGVVLTAAWCIKCLSLLTATRTGPWLAPMSRSEQAAAILLSALIVCLGLVPDLLLERTTPSLTALVRGLP